MLDNNQNVIIQPYQFKSSKVMKTPYGLTLHEIVDQMYSHSNIPPNRRRYDILVEVDGVPVARDRWDFVPSINSHILVSTLVYGDQGGGDGKLILRAVMMLAVVAIAIYTGGAAAGAMGFVQNSAATGTQFAITSGLVSMAVMTAGSMLVNAIAPIRPLDVAPAANKDPKQAYSITGSQNRANLFGSIPVVLGRHKMFPVYGAAPYTEIVGDDEYLRMLFVWGYGPLKIEDIKIGDTDITSYTDYEIETREGRATDEPITLMTESVDQQQINLELVDPPDEDDSNVENGLDWEVQKGTVKNWTAENCTLASVAGGESGNCLQVTSTGGSYQQATQELTGTLTIGESYRAVAWVKSGTAGNVAGSIIVRGNSGATVLNQVDFTSSAIWTEVFFDFNYTYGDEEIVLRKGTSHASNPGTMLFDTVSVYETGAEHETWAKIIREVKEVNEISVDVLFPGGLIKYDSEGAKLKAEADLHIEYREKDTGTWTLVDNHFWKEKTTKPIRYGYRWVVDRTKTYEVRLYKTIFYPNSDRVSNTMLWSSVKGILNEHPITFPLPLAMTAIRIKATKQLNGIINELSGIVSSYATVWDGDSWTGEAVTSNPADLYRLVLMHPANVRARTIAQINDAELGVWHDFCDTEGYAFNMIRESATSVWETCADICAAGRGSPSLAEGMWGVVYDQADSTIVQHITPRNSWGFSSNKILFFPPHGFRIEFKNEDDDWKDDERIVLDDGYYLNNLDAFDVTVDPATTALTEATQFESISLIGITDPDLIWKFGRYHIAQARLRPEVYTLSMDFEHLVCRRGSKVLVSHDVPMWGSKWGRITSLVYETVQESSGGSGGTGIFEDTSDTTWQDTTDTEFETGEGVTSVVKVVGIKLDEKFSITSSAQYVVRIRRSDTDTSQVINLSTLPIGEYDTAIFATSMNVYDSLVPIVGDLVIIGELTKETTECLVKSIRSSDDLTATLELVDLAEEIYDADQGEIPPFNPNITHAPDITLIVPAVPNILSIQSGTETLELGINGYLSPRIFVNCGVSFTNIRIDMYEVRYRVIDTTQWSHVTCPSSDPTAICNNVLEGETYYISARSISIYGIPSEWTTEVSHLVIGQAELPSDVTYFTCNILGSEAHLSWYPVPDIDLSHYRIRWSPLTAYAVWGDSVDIVARVATPATSITVPAMKGSYLIKAVDYKGNESLNATVAVSSIIRIPGFTNAQTISVPPWDGQGYTTEYNDEFEGIILSLAPIGDNLVTNGEDFTGDPTPTGWEGTDGTLDSAEGGQDGNCLELTKVSGSYQFAFELLSLVVGKSYRFSAWVKSGTVDVAYTMGVINAASTITPYNLYGAVSGTSSGSWVNRTFDFVADAASSKIYLLKNSGGEGTILFDTVELYELGLSPTGSYILSDTVDLEGIYTARISASLVTSAINYGINLYNYPDLYEVTNLYGVDAGECGVDLEIITTQDDPDGSPVWTEWSRVIIGDFTARAFQFRLSLWSNDTDVTPIVEAVDIYVDLADRTQGFDQEISPGGEDVVYAAPFYAPPSLSISVQAGLGAYYTLSNQTRTGFHIVFSTGLHTISGIAKGYGLEEI